MERKYDVDCPEADALEDATDALSKVIAHLGSTAMVIRNRRVDQYRKQQERARQANAARWGQKSSSAEDVPLDAA